MAPTTPLRERIWKIVASQARSCIKDHPEWFAHGAPSALPASLAKRCSGQILGELQQAAILVETVAAPGVEHREALRAAVMDATRRINATVERAAAEAVQAGAATIIRRTPAPCGCQAQLCVSAVWFPVRKAWICPLCATQRPYTPPEESP